MINLLPPQEKEALSMEKTKKLALVFGCVIIFSLLSLGLVLFAVKFYVLENINYHQSLLDAMKKTYETPDFLEYKGIIQKYNMEIASTGSLYATQAFFSNALKAIVQVPRPEGLHFNSLVIEKTGAGELKVIISGVSDTRDNLLVFKEAVEKDRRIKNAYFPPENWIKAKDTPFSLTFNLEVNR